MKIKTSISNCFLMFLVVSTFVQASPQRHQLSQPAFEAISLNSPHHLSQRESTYQMFSNLLTEAKQPNRLLPPPLVCRFRTYKGTSSCLACLPECLKCANGTACLECFPGFVLTNSGRCCPTGKYWNGSSCAFCGTLLANCLACAQSATACGVCVAGYTATNGFCCPNGQFWNGSVCAACTAPCITCTLNATFCTSCNSSFPQLFATSGKCCASKKYWTGFACANCHTDCSQCIGDKNWQCTECPVGKTAHRDGALCCINGKTDSGTASGCVNCNSLCTSCDWTTNEDCNTCTGGKVLSFGYYTLLASGYCVNPGSYWSGTAQLACDPSCLKCEISATYCTQCVVGKYPLGGTCATCAPGCTACSIVSTYCSACSPGYLLQGYTCTPCTSPCLLCSGTLTTCTSCISGKVLSGSTCVCTSPCDTCATTVAHCLSCIPTFNLTPASTCIICSAGTYFNGTVCSACASPCSTCSSPGTTCLSCVPGFYLNAASCVSCASPCSTCSASATTCTACIPGYNLTPSTTCIQCASGQFFNGTVCAPCTSPCLTCSTSATTCTSCVAGSFLSGNTCPSCTSPCINCITSSSNCTSCIPGRYLSGNTCPVCQATCSTCVTSATNCLSCIANYSLTPSNTCITCAAGTYFNVSVCSPCSAQCLECVTIATNCTSCSNGKYLAANDCPLCVSPCSTCSSVAICITCVSGHWFNAGSCPACTSPCATCSLNGTTCLTCVTAHSLVGNLCIPSICTSPCNTCVLPTFCLTCVPNYYLSGSTCSLCTSPCQECTGPTTSDCSSCIPGYNKTPSNNCILCTSGTYFDGTVCTACLTPCSTCDSPALCLSCVPGHRLNGTACDVCTPPCADCSTSTTTCTACIIDYSISGATCLPDNCTYPCNTCAPTPTDCLSCHNGYYFDLTCQVCINSCATCSSATHCLSCLPSFDLTTSNTCIACASGTFFDGSACPSCASPCVTCLTAAWNCLSCLATHWFDGSVCLPCTPPCQECSASPTTCTACVPSYNLAPGNTCILCASHQYFNGTVCLDCTSPCSTCSGNATACTGCIAAHRLNGTACDQCLSPCLDCSTTTATCTSCIADHHLTPAFACLYCSPTEFFNGSVCVQCDLPCQGCTAAGANCTSCALQYFLSGVACLPCDPGCSSCMLSANNCQGCLGGYNLRSSDSSCIQCTSNEFFKSQNGSCTPCDASCLTCSDEASTSCLTCPPNRIFNDSVAPNQTCDPCPSECSACTALNNCQSCSAGYVLDGTNNCGCDSPCSTCAGTRTTCLTCRPGWYFDGSNCLPCNAPCAECLGNQNHCTACTLPLFSNGLGQCVGCGVSSFFDSQLQTCVLCDSGCSECTSVSNCIKCLSPLALAEIQSVPKRGYCLANCPVNQFKTQETDFSFRCKDCEWSCAACSGPGKTSCTLCYGASELKNGECKCEGKNTYYDSDSGECTYVEAPWKTLFSPITLTIDVDLGRAYLKPQDWVSRLSPKLYDQREGNVIYLKEVEYTNFEWKGDNTGFTIQTTFKMLVKDGYFLIKQRLDSMGSDAPLFVPLAGGNVIDLEAEFRSNSVQMTQSELQAAVDKRKGSVENGISIASQTTLAFITPLSASQGTALKKIANMFENILYYNGERLIIPSKILEMVSYSDFPLPLPNYFQVDESEINCTPATNYVAHDVSCNLLNNYGEDLMFVLTVVAFSGIIFVIYRILLKKLKAGSKLLSVGRFLNDHYGVTFIFIAIEGENMEILMFSLLNIFRTNGTSGQLIGMALSLASLGFIVLICLLGFKAIREFTRMKGTLIAKIGSLNDRDKLEGVSLTPAYIEIRKERFIECYLRQTKFGFMRFFLEDYRLDLKDIYYMTPLITIAKNFISQIIVISLADKGLVQVYLILAVQIAFTAFIFKARPKERTVENWVVICTHCSLSLYTATVIFISSVNLELETKELGFGIVMGCFLLVVAGGNILYILVSAVMLFVKFMKVICQKKDPIRERIVAECEGLDYKALENPSEINSVHPLTVKTVEKPKQEPLSGIGRTFKRHRHEESRIMSTQRKMNNPNDQLELKEGNERRDSAKISEGKITRTLRGDNRVKKVRVQRFKPIKMEQEPDLKDAPQNIGDDGFKLNSPLKPMNRTHFRRTRKGKRGVETGEEMNRNLELV